MPCPTLALGEGAGVRIGIDAKLHGPGSHPHAGSLGKKSKILGTLRFGEAPGRKQLPEMEPPR
jgi:hypothetical protein